MNSFYILLGVVAVVGVGILVYQSFGGGDVATRPLETAYDPAELQRTPGVAIGREDAPVTILEFADFQCPGCGQFATFVTPLIKERLVDQGLVRYVYYDFPLTQIHDHAFLASRAARCAGEQGKFWEYHDLLYARQSRWSFEKNPTEFFVDLAAEAGLDQAAFEACLRSDRYAEEVTRSLRFGESLGVTGTPTIFINGRRLPNSPNFAQLEALVREAAGEAQAAATDTVAITDTVAE